MKSTIQDPTIGIDDQDLVTEQEAQQAVQTLLRYMGEDPEREGLRDTPKRVVRAWDELTRGNHEDPAAILKCSFPVHGYDEVIACGWIEFYSTCEHHLLPFSGYVHVGYLPTDEQPSRVVGLSKLARLVECFARRLQIQEQLTEQIATALEVCLRPRGVAVVIQAKHLCMACRGVSKHKAVMSTSSMSGTFREQGPAREEFFRLITLANHSNGH